ncbi:MAG: hypothetical protein K9L17_08830 [Clostridiales bacterium]|nr:hypothetical protein [Clostridiales bacterium]MCF8022781.1 hypothetical protein [Clostridiales bacterium]
MTRVKLIIPFLLAAGLLAFWFFNQNVFMSSIDNSAVKQEEQSREKDDAQSKADNDKTEHNQDQDEKNEPSEQKQEQQPVKDPAKDNENKAPGSNKNNQPSKNEKPAITVEDIENKYKPEFTALREEYDAKIDNLINQALNEYRGYKEEGKDPPVLSLARKYIQSGNQLENECDKKFYNLLDKMKKELKKENLPLNIVEKAEKDYKDQKARGKKELIDKGLKFIDL